MKLKFLLFTVFFVAITAISQPIVNTVYADTFKITKRDGTAAELIIKNASKSLTGGVLTNVGNGKTAFITPLNIDTTSLSNRINLKLNKADTGAMLNPYLRKVDTANISNRINLKLNAADTASISNRINIKQNLLNGTGFISLNGTTVSYTNKMWVDSPQQVFPSANIAFTGTTAPSGTTNNSYRWSRVGNVVNFRINMSYSVAATSISQIEFTFPSDMPAPENNITGYTTGSDNLIPVRANGGNTKTIVALHSANINYNSGTPKIRVNPVPQNIQYLQIQGTYFTNN